MSATSQTIFSRPARIWSIYIVVMAVLAWLCFGSLRHHLLDTHDAESFADHLLIDQDPSYFFSPDKQQATGRLVADGAKYAVYLVFGNSPAAFHLAVVATHLLASLLLALLTYRLYAAPALAMLTGLLFLLNVTHFQAVHHISALEYPLGLACACAAWLLWESRHWARAWFFSMLMVLAVQTHPSLATLWLLTLHRLWQTRADRRTIYTFGATALPVALAVIASVLLASRQASTWHAIREYEAQSAIELVLGQIEVMLFLTSRLLSTAHWVPTPIYSRAPWEIFLGMAITVGLIYALYRRWTPFDLGALWILVGLFPYALLTAKIINSLPAGPSRYLYVASAGSSLLLAAALDWIVQRQRYAGVGLIVAIVATSYVYLKKVEAISLYTSGRSYSSGQNLELGVQQLRLSLKQGADLLPLNDVYTRLSFVLPYIGESPEEVIHQGLELAPQDINLRLLAAINLAESMDYQERKNGEKLLDEVRLAFEVNGQESLLCSNAAGIYHNIGVGYMRNERPQRAILAFSRALEYQPDKANSLNRLSQAQNAWGFELQQKGHFEQAHGAYAQAIKTDPQNADAHFDMGALHYIQGNYVQAIESYSNALDIDQESYILFNIGIALLANGDIDSANHIYARAIRELGDEEGLSLGAPDDLSNFITHQPNQHLARAAEHILATYWPKFSVE